MRDTISWPSNMKCTKCDHGLLYHDDFGCGIDDCECEGRG